MRVIASQSSANLLEPSLVGSSNEQLMVLLEETINRVRMMTHIQKRLHLLEKQKLLLTKK